MLSFKYNKILVRILVSQYTEIGVLNELRLTVRMRQKITQMEN